MPDDDDRALTERLAALEAEVKADAEAQSARKAAAVEKVRAQRAAQVAERDALRPKPAADAPRSVSRKKSDDDELDIGSALQLAKKAQGVQRELARKPKRGEKSWVKSGVASLMLGPIGWLYAGSMREAVPASAIWVLGALLASKILPMVLLMPVLMVALPLSAIAGVMYAVQYNRAGGRQRLFDGDKNPPKQLPP